MDTLPKIKSFTAYEVEADKYILKSQNFTAVQINQNIILPFLGSSDFIKQFPCVHVDMGAVKFVCNGARIMRPGITKFDTFKKDDIVIVKDQNYEKSLAAGIALDDSEVAASKSKGYVIDNLHYISDKFWEVHKEITA
jgi:PUA domain protein